jgi:hypothetical protein
MLIVAFQPSATFDLTVQRFDTSSTVHFRSSPKDSPDGIVPAFSLNVHYHGSLPQQLGAVWDLLLKADPEGPSLINNAAANPPPYKTNYFILWCLLVAHG